MQLHRNPDFDAVAAAALPRAYAIATRLAPPPDRGKRVGSRYLWLNPNRSDQSLGSASLHLGTGAWADFARHDDPRASGYGLVSWAAYLYGVSLETADRWLGGMLGLCLIDPAAPPEMALLTEAEEAFAEQVYQRVEQEAPVWAAADLPADRSGLAQLYVTIRRQHGAPTHLYEYRRLDGCPALLVLRWDVAGGKICRPAIYARPAEDTSAPLRWAPAWPPVLPLFGAERLPLSPQAPVLLVEGEKTALAARSLFPDRLCLSVGGNLHARTDWSPLSGRSVVIWPDHDQAGFRIAETTRQRAAAAGAAPVSVIALPDHLPLGWDLADPLPPGWTPVHLHRLVAAAQGGSARSGPDLSILDLGRRPVPAVADALPAWRAWIETASRAKSVPADYVVATLLGMASGLLGGRLWLEVRPGWVEPAILWMLLVGDSASGKTPALEAVEGGLEALEQALLARYEQERLAHEADPNATPASRPPLHRCRIEDATVEAAAVLLAQEGRGLLGWMPEMAAWIASLARYRQAGTNDRGFWLKTYDGKPTIVDRRKLAEPLRVPALAVSLLGGIQPDLVPQLLGGAIDDGLAARFLVVWPDPVAPTTAVTADAWRRAETLIARAVARLYTATEQASGLTPAGVRPGALITLSPAARERFSDWHRAYIADQRQRHGAAIPPFVGKAPGHVARLALALHALEWAAGEAPALPPEVPEATLATAIDLRLGFFEAHRERAELDAGEPPPEKLARVLARYLVATQTELIDVTALRRHVRLPGLRTERRLRQALLELQAAGWLAAGVSVPRQEKDPIPSTLPLRPGLLAVAASSA